MCYGKLAYLGVCMSVAKTMALNMNYLRANFPYMLEGCPVHVSSFQYPHGIFVQRRWNQERVYLIEVRIFEEKFIGDSSF